MDIDKNNPQKINNLQNHHKHKHPFCDMVGQKQSIYYLLIGIFSLAWFLIRTGTRPSRALYPCQQIALANSLAFVPGLTTMVYAGKPIINKLKLLKKLKKYWLLPWLIIFILVTIILVLSTELAKDRSWGDMVPNQPMGTGIGVNPGRVVWTHDATATTGNYSNYWTQVDQAKVDNMMQMSLKALAGEQSGGSAVGKIFGCGTSCAGKKVAIKINMNNVGTGNAMDANSQTVNALLKQLVEAQFNPADITVFDASRNMRQPFVADVEAAFPQVKIVSSGDVQMSGENFKFESYCTPTGNEPVPQLWKDADYVVNMPLLKHHGSNEGPTLTFKNLFGMSNNPSAFHSCVSGNGLVGVYTASFIDKDGNTTSIDKKTKLIVGDGIFGDYTNNGHNIQNWSIFGNKAPNSLFVSQDPVAVDSVMYDVIQTQRGSYNDGGQKHLETAAMRQGGSLGVHEHPGLDSGCTDKNDIGCWKYTKIDYVICDISGNRLNPLCSGSGSTQPTQVVPTFSCIGGGVNCVPSPTITSPAANPTITTAPGAPSPTDGNNTAPTQTNPSPSAPTATPSLPQDGKSNMGLLAAILNFILLILEFLKSLLGIK